VIFASDRIDPELPVDETHLSHDSAPRIAACPLRSAFIGFVTLSIAS
jgi:hypothetical protein